MNGKYDLKSEDHPPKEMSEEALRSVERIFHGTSESHPPQARSPSEVGDGPETLRRASYNCADS